MMNFSKKDINDFISQLSLVRYNTGSLGTFFLNFLMVDSPIYKILEIEKSFGRFDNTEWRSISYNHFILNDSNYDRFWPEFYSQEPGLDEFLFVRHLIFNRVIEGLIQQNSNVFRMVIGNWQPNFYRKFSPIDIPADIKVNVMLPYLKGHGYTNSGTKLDALKLKQKIYCFFPYLKRWIPLVLVLHKHVILTDHKSLASAEFIKCLLDGESYNNYFNRWPVLEKIDEHVGVNMHDLILNPLKYDSSLNYLQDNIKDLDLTSKKLALIDIVKSDILHTLQLYGLDPEMNFDLNNDFDSFLKCCGKLVTEIKHAETTRNLIK